MAQDKVYLPSGSGGLLRYFDDYRSTIQISPQAVVGICGAVILIELFLRYGVKIG